MFKLLAEYQLVLQYPQIAELIYPELRRIFLTQLAHEMEMVELPEIPAICRDPDDDKVIATAIFGEVHFLLTTDQDLHDQLVRPILHGQGIQLTTIDELLFRLD